MIYLLFIPILVAMIWYHIKSGTTSTIAALVRFARLSRYFLILGAVTIAGVQGVLLLHEKSTDRTDKLIVLILTPFLFLFAGLVGLLLVHIMLNGVLYKLYKSGQVIEDLDAVRRIRSEVGQLYKIVHTVLFAVRKTTLHEVLDRVCPI